MIDDEQLVRFYVRLKARQRQVVELTSDGLSNHAIGQRLFIAPSVVAGHLTNVYGELGNVDELADTHPNRYLLIHLFAPFFERHPEMRNVLKS